jgi:hypothetical protein
LSFQSLRPFSSPSANGDGALDLQAEARRDGKLLRFGFILSGDVDKIKIPHFARPLRREDELWKTTCFEAFVSTPGLKSYWELNFSPGGAWNCYRFDDYRQGMREELGAQSVEIQPRAGFRGYQLHAAIDLSSVLSLSEALEVSLTAVIEGDEQTFWALRHAGARPDFHLRESFVARLGG